MKQFSNRYITIPVAALTLVTMNLGIHLPAHSATELTCGSFKVEIETGNASCSETSPYLLTLSNTEQPGNFVISQSNSESATADRIIFTTSTNSTAVIENLNINSDSGSPLTVSGTGNTTLLSKGKNTLASAAKRNAGLQKGTDGHLIFDNADETNPGTIIATGGVWGAGIGGGNNGSTANITINGGTITAKSNDSGAGIGGGANGSATNITINDGTISTPSAGNGSGIGGGGNGSATDITINGGTVNSTGNSGIGGGANGSGSNITITGGEVKAEGSYGAGIGGGEDQQGTHIVISGGYVVAMSTNGAGIGPGAGASSTENEVQIIGTDKTNPTKVRSYTNNAASASAPGLVTSTDPTVSTFALWNDFYVSKSFSVLDSGSAIPSRTAFWITTPAKQSTITFSPGEHSSSAVNQDTILSWLVSGSEYFFPQAPTADPGYTFTGWTGPNQETPSGYIQILTGIFNDLTYTANYDLIPYALTYDLGEDAVWTNDESGPTTYTVEGLEAIAQVPSRTGYKFLGWSTSSTADASGIIPAGTIGDLTLTAQWEKITAPEPTTTTSNPSPSSTTVSPTKANLQENGSKKGLAKTGMDGQTLVAGTALLMLAGVTMFTVTRRRYKK